MDGSMAKKKESYSPEPTPDRQLKTKSGWCITADHKQCKHKFSFGICGCECHKKGKK